MKHLSNNDFNDNLLENVPTPVNEGDAANKAYADNNILNLNRMSMSNSYRKRVVHNLDYQHADAAAAVETLGSIYPQTFIIDDVANELFTISANPQVVSVFDWTTGQYKGRCFSLGRAGVCESADIRYEGGSRFLYVTGTRNEVAKFDITTLPTNLTTISPVNTYNIDAYHHMKYRHGRWIIFSNSPDSGTTPLVNRGKFGLFDDNFNQIGIGQLDNSRIGKYGDYLTEGGPPKIQSFDEGDGFIVVSIGAQWRSNIPKTLYRSQGIRIFTPHGVPVIDSIIDPELMLQRLIDNGYTPSLVESEGVYISNNKIYTLCTMNSASEVGPGDGGLLIFEEFSDHPDAIDFSEDATAFNAPDIRLMQSSNHPVAYDGKLHDLWNWSVLDTLPKILDYMISVGQDRFSFYAKDADVKDLSGASIPDTKYVEIRNVNNYTFYMKYYDSVVDEYMVYDPSSWKIRELVNRGIVDSPDANGWRRYRFGNYSEYRRTVIHNFGSISAGAVASHLTGLPVGFTTTEVGGIDVGAMVNPGGSNPARFNVGARLESGQLNISVMNLHTSALNAGTAHIPVTIKRDY